MLAGACRQLLLGGPAGRTCIHLPVSSASAGAPVLRAAGGGGERRSLPPVYINSTAKHSLPRLHTPEWVTLPHAFAAALPARDPGNGAIPRCCRWLRSPGAGARPCGLRYRGCSVVRMRRKAVTNVEARRA